MRIAVTGSTGFIGSAAAKAAEDRGHDIVRITRLGALSDDPTTIEADITDLPALKKIASSVDAVVHCAASDDPALQAVLEQASFALIEGLPAGGRFAMQAGSLVFGDTGKQAVSNPAFAPPSALRPRVAFEDKILSWAHGDVRTRIVYGSYVYGGPGAVLPAAMINAATKVEATLYFGGGDQVWSTVHVDDFGALLIDAVEGKASQGTQLFAAGRPVQMKPVADIIGAVLGVPSRPVSSEADIARLGVLADALRVNQHFSSQAARTDFGWQPQYSDSADTLVAELSNHASHATL